MKLIIFVLPLSLIVACSSPLKRDPASITQNTCFYRIQKSFLEDQNSLEKRVDEISGSIAREEISLLLKSSNYTEIFENSQSLIEKEYYASLIALIKKDRPELGPNEVKEIFYDFFRC